MSEINDAIAEARRVYEQAAAIPEGRNHYPNWDDGTVAGVLGPLLDLLDKLWDGVPLVRVPMPGVVTEELLKRLEQAQSERLVLLDAVDPRVAALKAALREACDLADGHSICNKHDVARLAELRKLAEGA